jgi:DNA mismatch repair protein MutL
LSDCRSDRHAGLAFLALAHGHYAVFETAAGLVLLDRRAAHERVWFERLAEPFRAGQVPGQRLLLPLPLELDPVASALLIDRRGLLQAHGFEIAEFGRNFFRVEAVPGWMEPADAEPFLRDLLGLSATAASRTRMPTWPAMSWPGWRRPRR